MSETDREYFQRRADEEWAAAARATHIGAKRIHLQMAERYADLAGAIRRRERVVTEQAIVPEEKPINGHFRAAPRFANDATETVDGRSVTLATFRRGSAPEARQCTHISSKTII